MQLLAVQVVFRSADRRTEALGARFQWISSCHSRDTLLVTKNDASDISWAVVENGLDFLEHAVQEMAKDPADNKYAAIHLFGAIEVLIKARLIREHWTLACVKADGATLARFKNGDLPTVDGMQGLKRLETNAGLAISKQQTLNVDAVRRLRNRVAHFALVGIDPNAVKVELARGLDFVVWFLEKYILPGAPVAEAELIDEALAEISVVLGEIKAFVAERLATLKPELAAAEMLLQCPQCAQATLTLTDEHPKCLFCWWCPGDPEAAADEYVNGSLGLTGYGVIKDGGDWPIWSCPECETNAMVEGVDVLKDIGTLTSDPHDTYVSPDFLCFNCGFHCSYMDLDKCSYCGTWTTSFDGPCPDCFEAMIPPD